MTDLNQSELKAQIIKNHTYGSITTSYQGQDREIFDTLAFRTENPIITVTLDSTAEFTLDKNGQYTRTLTGSMQGYSPSNSTEIDQRVLRRVKFSDLTGYYWFFGYERQARLFGYIYTESFKRTFSGGYDNTSITITDTYYPETFIFQAENPIAGEGDQVIYKITTDLDTIKSCMAAAKARKGNQRIVVNVPITTNGGSSGSNSYEFTTVTFANYDGTDVIQAMSTIGDQGYMLLLSATEGESSLIVQSGVVDLSDYYTKEETNTKLAAYDLKDRAYVANQNMGYKVLDKDKSIISQMTEANTIYEIRYDFDLGGETLTVPENCTLKFEGGSLKNGSVIGDSSGISADIVKIFDSITLGGRFRNEWQAEWFGARIDHADNSSEINNAITQIHHLSDGGCLVLNAKYDIQKSVYLRAKVSVRGMYRNSHYAQADDPSFVNEGCGLRYVGSDSNLWIIDFILPDNSTKEYNDLFVGNIASWKDARFNGIFLKDFDVLVANTDVSKGVFGAIRLNNLYNCNISNLGIYGTLYGIGLSSSWNNTLNNIYIATYINALYLGYNCTINSLINIYALKLTGDSESWGNALFSNPEVLFPSYVSDLKSSAILAEGSRTDQSRTNLSDLIIQGYDAMLCASNFSGAIDHPYLEGTFKTFVWVSRGNLYLGAPSPLNGLASSGYEFGTMNGYLNIDGYRYCRCYDNSQYLADSNVVSYDISVNNHDNIYYYDSYEGNEVTGEISNLQKTRTKRYLNIPQVIIGRVTNTNYGENIINSTLALGNNIGSVVSIEEFFRRPEFNYKEAQYYTYADLSVFTEPIVDRSNTIIATGISDSASNFKFNSPLPIKGCNLHFKCGFLDGDSDHFFDIYGDNTIIVDKLTYNEKKFIKLCGTQKIRLTFIVRNDYNDIGVGKNFLVNPEFEYPYEIRLITSHFSKVYTNTNNPLLSSTDIGYSYYNTNLKKPVWWNGTSWLEAVDTSNKQDKPTIEDLTNDQSVNITGESSKIYTGASITSLQVNALKEDLSQTGIEEVLLFSTGDSPSIEILGVSWANSDVPTFEANKTYEIHIMYNSTLDKFLATYATYK